MTDENTITTSTTKNSSNQSTVSNENQPQNQTIYELLLMGCGLFTAAKNHAIGWSQKFLPDTNPIARYTLVIKRKYVTKLRTEIEDSMTVEFESLEQAQKYTTGISRDCTWEIIHPPTPEI